MRFFISFLKLLANLFFFLVYLLVMIVVENYIFWLILTKWLWKVVPPSTDPIHLKLAIIVLFLVLFITILFRKYFYFSICENNKKITNIKKEKKVEPKNEKIEDEPEIYINKEIK